LGAIFEEMAERRRQVICCRVPVLSRGPVLRGRRVTRETVNESPHYDTGADGGGRKAKGQLSEVRYEEVVFLDSRRTTSVGRGIEDLLRPGGRGFVLEFKLWR